MRGKQVVGVAALILSGIVVGWASGGCTTTLRNITFTPTIPRTATQSPTSTPINTTTGTFTATFTPTIPASATDTPAPTTTFTLTATIPFTATNPPSATFTNTIPPTLTNTPVNTSTATVALSATYTNTVPPGSTATNTPMNTSTATVAPSATYTNTIPFTLSNTPANTSTATLVPSATYTPTTPPPPTATNTPANTSTFSPTSTSTRTPTPANTSTFTFTPAPTNTSTPAQYFYVAGGFDPTSGNVSTTYSAQAMSGGGMGSWNTTTSYPIAEEIIALPSYAGNLWGCAGYNAVSSVYRATAGGGTVGTWNSDTAFPVPLAASAVVWSGANLFVLGGRASGVLSSTVYVNTMSGAGLTGSWTTTSPIAVVLGDEGGAISSAGYVYTFGGYTSTGMTSTIFSAPITGGTLGAWSSVGTLPQAVANPGTATDGSTAYVVGGEDSITDEVNTVYAVPLTAGGNIGSIATSSFPNGGIGPGAVFYSGYLYVFGGYKTTTATATNGVYSAPVSGTAVGGFSSLNALPRALGYLKTTVAP